MRDTVILRFKVRKNVLDVSYHVSQYQNIITELKSEIGRLKEKIVDGGNLSSSRGGGGGGGGSGGRDSKTAKKQAEELRELRDEMVASFREQMKLRNQLMKIDTHILGLSMEFEKNNIIINEYEKEKATNKHDKSARRRMRRNRYASQRFDRLCKVMCHPKYQARRRGRGQSGGCSGRPRSQGS
jgi:hypothetical protein